MKKKDDGFLTKEQALAKCRQAKRRLICAGQVLALISLLRETGWKKRRFLRPSGWQAGFSL